MMRSQSYVAPLYSRENFCRRGLLSIDPPSLYCMIPFFSIRIIPNPIQKGLHSLLLTTAWCYAPQDSAEIFLPLGFQAVVFGDWKISDQSIVCRGHLPLLSILYYSRVYTVCLR